MHYLKDKDVFQKIEIHVSGEMQDTNTSFVRAAALFPVKRVILSRRVTISGIREMVRVLRNEHVNVPELEAFMLNEKCVFSGAYCNSLHCDELLPVCREYYELGTYDKKSAEQTENEHPVEEEACKNPDPGDADWTDSYLPGRTGCGLCSIYDLMKAGVSVLKLVSRGNYSEDTLKDIVTLKKCIRIGEQAESAEDYRNQIKKEIFRENGCSGNCYYGEDLKYVKFMKGCL